MGRLRAPVAGQAGRRVTARTRFDAVVLAGGDARRMGGVDKPALAVGAASLLDRVLLAVADAQAIVVVGPVRPVSRAVRWTLESPPGGGPAAALAAGMSEVSSPVVAVLAADLPFLHRAVIGRLLLACGTQDGAVLVDEEGRDQLLVGVWRTDVLRDALPDDVADASLRQVLPLGRAVRVTLPPAPGTPAPWTDCDTPTDLARARRSV